ncbi:MAG TPA: FecR family protein [Thermoanaerobaculia bacterium]|nr:FecR family protein [Thermoanaerobaculia bacterium]
MQEKLMRKLAILALLTLAAAPLYAERGQSYFTYDDGGTVVRQSDDGRQIDARVNIPLFPGDEITTARRGRSEIRLSDGNVLGLDQSTQVRLGTILNSVEGADGTQTVVELRYGHVVLQRASDETSDVVRLDTDNASYVADDEAIYAVDTDRGRDRITVFEGNVEVRTPQKPARLRAGESASVDDSGLFGLVNQSYASSDDFERWFLRRSERYGHGSSRYLDRSLAYADADLSSNGTWVYVSGFSTWCWRPQVAAGWRPYFNGEWVSGPSGALIWASYEPWGWVPYHYGRWALDPFYGWVWLPGAGYSPAWVYWMYSPDYVGWAPAGWWDCYRPYYNWCYRPYARASWDVGWFGRMRVGDIDFRPWTFLRPNEIVGVRVDRAALSADAARERLLRGSGGSAGSGLVAVSTQPARFTRNELRDPSQAVNNIIRRAGNGGTTGGNDLAPFIRRDPDLSNGIRERVVRSRGGESGGGGVQAGGGLAPIGRGGLAPIGGGGLAPIGGGSVAPIGGGAVVPTGAGAVAPTYDRRIGRDTGSPNDRGGAWRDRDIRNNGQPSGSTGRVEPNPQPATGAGNVWRDRIGRGTPPPQEQQPAATTNPNTNSNPNSSSDEWRRRSVRGRTGDNGAGSSGGSVDRGGSSIPRRIIDAIGGPRVYPGDRGRDTGSRGSSGSTGNSGSTHSSPPPPPPPQPHNDGGGNHGNGGGHEGHGKDH